MSRREAAADLPGTSRDLRSKRTCYAKWDPAADGGGYSQPPSTKLAPIVVPWLSRLN
jgi:hypothetical protein